MSAKTQRVQLLPSSSHTQRDAVHLRLTDLLGHLLHDVSGDVCDGRVAQTLDVLEVDVAVQLHRADAPIINVRIQGADEDQESQEQQREDQLLQEENFNVLGGSNCDSLKSKSGMSSKPETLSGSSKRFPLKRFDLIFTSVGLDGS